MKLSNDQERRAMELEDLMFEDTDAMPDAARELIYLRDEVERLRAMRDPLDDALNSGDGVYRP